MAKIFQTKGYKILVGYVYGWGACAVIIGALFKIMHFPGAGLILTIGMLVEALIFFISAFEPLMEHYDWARVFPVLGKGHGEWEEDGNALQHNPMQQVAMPAAQQQQTITKANLDLGLEPTDVDMLREGIYKIAETANNFATVPVRELTEKMVKASASFDVLGEQTQEAGKVLETSVKGFSDGCGEINRILLEASENLTSQIRNNCERLSVNMGQSADNFGTLTRIMDEQLLQVKSQSDNYTQQISAVSKNIGALNALYELQIHETSDCLESFRGMQGDMGEMLENVSLSLDNAKLFKQESQQLANNVASLNSVYGNMLSVINNN